MWQPGGRPVRGPVGAQTKDDLGLDRVVAGEKVRRSGVRARVSGDAKAHAGNALRSLQSCAPS